jgi:hypothetical protein
MRAIAPSLDVTEPALGAVDGDDATDGGGPGVDEAAADGDGDVDGPGALQPTKARASARRVPMRRVPLVMARTTASRRS